MDYGYQRIPGLKPHTRMRACRQYSNLPPLYRSMWDEYRAVRSTYHRLLEILDTMEPTKPRFKFENGRPKRVVHLGQYEIVYKEAHKAKNRLGELALYFYIGIRWIAPDFTEEEMMAQLPKNK